MFPISPAYGSSKLSGCYRTDSGRTHDQAWGFLGQNQSTKGQKSAVQPQVASGEMKFQIFHSNNLRPREFVT